MMKAQSSACVTVSGGPAFWRLRRMAALVAVLGCAWAACARACPADEADSWEYLPYRIRVWLAGGPSAALTPAWQDRIRDALENLSPLYGGATWRLEAEAAPAGIGSSIAAAIEDLTVEQVQSALHGAPAREKSNVQAQDPAGARAPDKLMLLGIREEEGRFLVACRELDWHTRTLGPTVRFEAWQPALVSRVAADAVGASFQALVRVESSRGKKATVRVRAGGLVSDAECPSAVGSGDVLRPVIRRNDRRGEPKPDGIQVLDWTYLLVREAQEYLLDCDVYSAMRNPLVGRSSVTVERMALKVRAGGNRTTLQLVDRDQPARPLEGYEMFAKKPIPADSSDANPSLRLGLTDWRGRIDVDASDLPLRLIYVKNGAHLVARIPVVPGYQPLEVVPLASDDKRLEAEAFVRGMESTVMDLVARRAILAARIHRRIAEGNLAAARQLLEELKGFQTKEDLEMMLASRQAALAAPDKRQQQRIDQLLTGTRSLLNKYLNPEELVALERAISGGAPAPATQPAASPEAPEREPPSPGGDGPDAS